MKQIALLLVSVLMVVTGCQRAPKTPPEVVMRYDGKYTVDMYEWTEAAGRHLVFRIYTIDSFGCTNYYIKAATSTSPGVIQVTIDGVTMPRDCSPGRARAFNSSTDLSLANGSYMLSIKNLDRTEYGTLTVTDSAYILSYDDTNNVSFTNKVVHRLPANTIYGMLYADDTVTFTQAQDLIDSIQYYGATAFTGDTGNYGLITVLPGNTYMMEDDGTWQQPYKRFIYNYPGDIGVLKDLMRRYRDRYDGSVSIIIQTMNDGILNSHGLD